MGRRRLEVLWEIRHAPHTDSVTSTIEYRVPSELASDILSLNGSVTISRTRGELFATGHDVQANHLALNLVDDIEQAKAEGARREKMLV